MLATILNTNEVKNAAGTEEEFQRLDSNGRSVEYSLITEAFQFPHRLLVGHQESGLGASLVRRSRVGFKKTVAGANGDPVIIEYYVVARIPVGNLAATTEPKNVCANLMSFMASLGASTTILFDNTGNGAATLLNGGL
jgi:hypothetical protein